MTFVPFLLATVSAAQWWLAGSLFILGACIGSFLNVVVYRLPAGLSLILPPSNCPQCKTPITAIDNIPIVSWLLLRGRCRHCTVWIPLRYPLVELLTAIVFARIGWVAGAANDTPARDLVEDLTLRLMDNGLPLLVSLIAASCLIVVACWCCDGVTVSWGFSAIVAGITLGFTVLSPDPWQRLASVGFGALAGLVVGGMYQSIGRRADVRLTNVPDRVWPNTAAIGVLAALLIGNSELPLFLVSATTAVFGYSLFVRQTDVRFQHHPVMLWAVFMVVLCGVLANPFQAAGEISPRYGLAAFAVIGVVTLLTRLVVPRQS